jgi:AraC-like DNA-binding protein
MNGKLDFFYYASYPEHTYVDFHSHNCFELVYYVSGTGTMNLGGRILNYSPHSMTFTRPNHMHDERHDEASEVIFFGFLYDDDPISLPNALIFDTDQHEVLQLLLKMKKEAIEQPPFSHIRLNLLLNEVLLLIGRTCHQDNPGYNPAEQLFLARRFMEENYSQSINLHTLAEISGYSYDYFRHLFKAETGLSPVRYIMEKRLAAAKHMLVNTRKTISQIAMDCGFSTTSQFCDMFKRATHTTPLQYRKKPFINH